MQREPQVPGGSGRAPGHASDVGVVRPYHIHVAQSVLDELQLRLHRTRWAGADPDAGWDCGTHHGYLRELVTYWRDSYNWRAHEAALDELTQFVARVDETDLHFVHLHAHGTRRIPLLLLHGWLDSFHRYRDVAPMLASLGFDVVVPSLPGFAFTPALEPLPQAQPMRHVARMLEQLMVDVLDYPQFGVIGGDLGSTLAQILAIDHPASVIGVHLTDLGRQADASLLTWIEQRYVARMKERFLVDGGYAMVQAAMPRSIAVELTDSPVGLASWLVDRYHAWSDGDLDALFGKDTLLTAITLIWATGSIGSALAMYRAETRSPSLVAGDRVTRPVALALFPYDIGGIPPRRLAGRTLDVERWTEMPRGGHFAALEDSELYARDAGAFFRSLEAG